MMSKILPNFLIAGAAKCGTSSLHRYLSQHPHIFLSKVKEPRFLSSQVTRFPLGGPKDDQVEKRYVKQFDEYVKLFEEARGYEAVGEASADTLYFYKRTIPVIREFLGDPKIIICLRNPVRRAFSAYQHLVRDLREELSFEEGLADEGNRIRDNWELIYHYTAASHYYDAVRAFMENFSSVKVILSEDQSNRPQSVLREIFSFLGVDTTVDVNTGVRYNVSGKPKSQWLHQFFFEENRARRLAQPIVRTLFSEETRVMIAQQIQKRNLTRLSIQPTTQARLQRFFEPDISKLERLLDRDLSLWRR